MKERIRKRRCPVCLKSARFYAGRCDNCGHREDESDVLASWGYDGSNGPKEPARGPRKRPGSDAAE